MKKHKILIMMQVVLALGLSWQVCQGEEQPPKAVALKSHDAKAVLEKKAKRVTQQQREEAAAISKEKRVTAPNSPLKPVFEADQPNQERGRP